jgi:putative peptidoglycan lipid II flippase
MPGGAVTQSVSTDVSERPGSAEGDVSGGAGSFVRGSVAGSVWSVVSRMTGLGQTVAVGAVLGATYLGNTYQSVNALPNIIYYQLLAGSLFASLLVPPLVHHVDGDDLAGARRLAGGVFTVLATGGLALSALLLLAGPLIVRLLTLGVADPADARAQARVGLVLLTLFVPQILFYLVAGSSGALLNARGRFALAAGAPAVENLGMIATLIVVALVFGTGVEVGAVSDTQLRVLGLGTTAAVAAHAATVWLGARARGLPLVPNGTWRSPEVVAVIRRAVPMLAYTGLQAAQVFAVFVVADRLRGGLVAFQLALSLFFLPVAVITWPVARALLPQLSRLHRSGDARAFRSELGRGLGLTSFVTVPTALAYLALAVPIAAAITFGALRDAASVRMVALSLAALAPGVLGENWFILGSYAFYARLDARTPLRAMIVRVGVSTSLMAATWWIRGPLVLPMLGLSLSAGSLAGAVHVWSRLHSVLPPAPPSGGGSPGVRVIAASLAMLAPAAATAWFAGHVWHGQLSEVATVLASAIVGVAAYLVLQTWLRAPELRWLRGGGP